MQTIDTSLYAYNSFAAVKLLNREQVEELQQRVLMSVQGSISLNEVRRTRHVLGRRVRAHTF